MRIILLSLLSAAAVSAMYPNWNGQAAAYGQSYEASGCARWQVKDAYNQAHQQQFLQDGQEPYAVSGARIYFRKCAQQA
ncbi:hypothetical protein MIR68_008140 [Amoeboaphelidium protococcarum]|nr:hypothetical protein MIR68_008140 [Amoeboaphelidium protococcarum]